VELLVVLQPDADAEDVERLSRQLRDELPALDVDEVVPAASRKAPPGAKSGAAASVTEWLITLSAGGGVFVNLVATVKDWLARRTDGHPDDRRRHPGAQRRGAGGAHRADRDLRPSSSAGVIRVAAGRQALVVATYRYADGGPRQLAAPEHDAEAFAAVLEDPETVGFDVTMLVNEPHHVVGEAIADFYADCRRDDLTLLYFSGHGLKDDEAGCTSP
jgi:hypothetical protein